MPNYWKRLRIRVQPPPSMSELWNCFNAKRERDIYAFLTHEKCK